MPGDKQYLVHTVYRDHSRKREVLTLPEIRDRFAKPEPIFPGATIQIEEL